VIHFTRVGTQLQVRVDRESVVAIPENNDRPQLVFFVDVGGDPIAAAALLVAIRTAFERRIAAIRQEAYQQGARDRAQHAETFSNGFCTGMYRGGCYP
jgi:hypothetical protein